MLSRKPLGVIGAAILGLMALLGTNVANAVIDLDGVDAGAVVYVQETITKTLQGRDGATYYAVDGGDENLDVTAALGFGTLASASLVIRYDFTGMILTETSMPVLSTPFTAPDDIAVRQGGKAKDDYVVFLVTGLNSAPADSAVLTLTLEDMAISTGGGSINMHVTDDLSIPADNRASHSGAVTMKSGLTPTKTPNNPTAVVSEKFLLFDGGTGAEATQMVTLGSVTVAVTNETYRNAQDGEAIGADLTTLIAPGANTINTAPTTVSSVVFKGDFSFVERAWLETTTDGTAVCSGDSTSNLLMDMDAETMMRDTTQLKKQSLAYLNEQPNLCIMVHGKDSEMAVAIPATAPYMVEKTIVLSDTFAADSKFRPMPAPAPLGMIMRDGTTVHIPYITQFADYNQRIVIVNRGSEAAYSMSFMTEDGVTATPGMEAEGTLPAMSTTYLSLMYDDVVTIEGPFNRASATLIVEREPSQIDVVVSQTNSNGGTDTVKYTP